MNYVKLKDVCRINMGQSPDSASYNCNGYGLPFFQGNADFGEKYPKVRIWCDSPIKTANEHDILISVRAPIGAINYADCECCIGRGLASLTPDQSVLSSVFLFWFLKSKTEELNNKGAGSTFKAIGKKVLEEILIPDISIDQQRSCVLTLESLYGIIQQRRYQMTLLDDLIKSRFVEVFGDPTINPKGYLIKSMSEIAEYWNGLTYRPEDVSEQGTIVLRSSNIQNMSLDFNDIVRVNCKIGEKKFVKDNDILMCSRNGSAKLVGKVALIRGLTEPMSFGAFMMIIRSDYYPYLMTYYQLPAFRSQITTGATTTINQITGNMLDKVMLPIPDKDAINKFASFVSQIDKSKFVVQKALEKAQLLFDSLMQQYFG